MNKIYKDIVTPIGKLPYTLKDVEFFDDPDEGLQINIDSLGRKQDELAITLIQETSEFDLYVFNYVLNISGKKAKEVATLCESTSSAFSQARREEETKPLGTAVWKLFRYYMTYFISERLNKTDQLKNRNSGRLTDQVMHPKRLAG
jgi:hypothetical protein